ncbi:DUF4350 domain-containing protein [Flagellimonas sp. 2504JD1-5]
MDRRSKVVVAIFSLVVLGIIITEIVRPKPINWRPSYTAADKIPFGCFVLYSELPEMFGDSEIATVEESVYNALIGNDSSISSNYIFINDYVDLDEQETNQILDYVAAGNTVFMAATSIAWQLSDTLNIAIESEYGVKEGSSILTLTNKKIDHDKFKLSRGNFNSHFTSVDSTNTTILGHITYTIDNFINDKPDQTFTKPNFIKTRFGNGHFVLNTTPVAYSNYYMLKGNQDYVSHTLSYLEDKTLLFWDNYKKSGRVVIDSPMRFVLNQKSLKWVYYLTMLGLLLFVLFKAKREQRIIPVIEPLKNSSVEFAQAVGSLYHQNKDFTDLVQKKLNYFLANIRNRYHIDTGQLNDKTIQILAAKAGKDIKQTRELIEYIVHLKHKKSYTEQESIELNKKITAFKQ